MKSILLAIIGMMVVLTTASASSYLGASVISETVSNAGYINTAVPMDSGHGYIITAIGTDTFMTFAGTIGAVAGAMAVEGDSEAISAVGVITGEHTQQVYFLTQVEAEYLYNLAQTASAEQVGVYAYTMFSKTVTMAF